jgi:hypothetical protein
LEGVELYRKASAAGHRILCGIKNNCQPLNGLTSWFIDKVLGPAFQLTGWWYAVAITARIPLGTSIAARRATKACLWIAACLVFTAAGFAFTSHITQFLS